MDPSLRKKIRFFPNQIPQFVLNNPNLPPISYENEIPVRDGIPDFLTDYALGEIHWNLDIDPKAYDVMIASLPPYRLKRIDLPMLHYVRGDVLEIGCGTARLAEAVERRGGHYFGIDPVYSFLKHAKDHKGLTRLVLGQGEQLPFKDESFDTLLSGYFAYRYVDPELGLPEARRVLKEGGIFTFDLINYWILKILSFRIPKRRLFRDIPRSPSREQLFEFMSYKQIEKLAKSSGFKIEKMISTVGVPFLSSWLSKNYFKGKQTVYFGYDVIIVLRAI